jgi:hypothetical protein
MTRRRYLPGLCEDMSDPAEALGSIAVDLIGGKGAGGAAKGGLKAGLRGPRRPSSRGRRR